MKLTVACCQTPVVDNKQQNLNVASQMIEQAIQNYHPELVVLPEMFSCPYENSVFSSYAESENGETVQFLSQTAKRYHCVLVGGSIPEKDGEKLYNTSFVFDSDGHCVGKHRKKHLFDISIPGKLSFRESDTLSSGKQDTVLSTSLGKIGVAICFDLRFPEQFIRMATQTNLIVVPAAFNTKTGPLHWELLLRARAVDSQSFLIACSPARNPNASYHAYGHSSIVSPWGKILAELQEEPGIVAATLNLEEALQVRRQIPLRR